MRLCLAPLRGVTDVIFRDTYARFFCGFDRAVMPFLTTAKGPRIKPTQLKEVLPENNRRMEAVPQILSKTEDRFLVLAEALFQLGYETVNWNLGCPYPMVAKKGRGSGLLPQPEVIERFLERVIPAMSAKLSIKMRLGRFETDEINTLLPILNRFDLKEIIIHPRTGVQMYTGKPDLEAFAHCLRLTHHHIVYNGDIVDLITFKRLRDQFPGIRDWMIGRGAIVNPFLAGWIKGCHYPSGEVLSRFKAFHDMLYERYGQKLFGPSHLVNRMKGLWSYFAKAFHNGDRLRKRINKTNRTQHYEEVVDAFFATAPRWNKAIFKAMEGNRAGV